MKKNDDILMNMVSDAMKDVRCKQTVDVTDRVMESISHVELLVPKAKPSTGRSFFHLTASVAACLAVGVGVSLALLNNSNDSGLDNHTIMSLFAVAYDNNSSYSSESEEEIYVVEDLVSPFFDEESFDE